MRKWPIPLSVLLSLASPIQARDAARPSSAPFTHCPTEPMRHARHGAQPAHVLLWFGVESGMTEAEVRRIDPKLVGKRMQPGYELFPGLPVKASTSFDGQPSLASAVVMLSTGHADEIKAALTSHYGRPVTAGPPGHFLDIPIPVSGGTRWVENEALKWCDGGRQFQLSGQHDVWLTISPIDK